MLKGWRRLAVVLGMTAAIVTAVPVVSMAEPVDLSYPCSMTISAGSFEDLANANVVYDVYKVAEATEIPGQDTYAFTLNAAYAIPELAGIEAGIEDPDSTLWETYANAAAAQTLTKGNTIEPVIKDQPADSRMDVNAGLYLVVAKTQGLKNYIKTVTGEDGTSSVVTLAKSKQYIYSFKPQLISVPTKEGLMTSDPTEWIYDITDAAMKPEQAVRFGDLVITKILDNYENNNDAMFVFSVKAEDDFGEIVYDDVIGLDFKDAGSRTCSIIGKIPVGAKVTVSEVYAGASYTLVRGPETQEGIIPAPQDKLYIEFENDYNGGLTDGPGVVNKFEYKENANGDPTIDFGGNDTDNADPQ